MSSKENVLINYEGANGGDFLRSCLWILKNTDKELYIDHENKLRLNSVCIFKILPTGQVVPDNFDSTLMDLLRWTTLDSKRQKGFKVQHNWETCLKYEYDMQSATRNLNIDKINSNVDIQITHDPWEITTQEHTTLKMILEERDNHISKIFNHNWDQVYWIFNTSLEDTAWSLYFDSVKNIHYSKNTEEIMQDAKRRLTTPKQMIRDISISSRNIISHSDIINDKIHTFLNLEKTDVYVQWYNLYSKLNKLKNPPPKYYELLEFIKSSDLNVA